MNSAIMSPSLAPDVGREHWPEPVPPKLHSLVTNVDPAFEQQILDVTQRQRIPDVQHHCHPDHLGRRVEIAKRIADLAHSPFYQPPAPPAILL